MIPVFDIGDTLVEAREFSKSFFRDFLKRNGVENPPEYPFQKYNEFKKDDIEEWFAVEGIEVDAGDAVSIYRAEKRKEFLEQSADMLREISKVEMPGFISDNSLEAKLFFRDIFRSQGIDYRGFVVSEEVGARKPDSEIFQAFLNRRGVDGSECVYFGNNAERDAGCTRTGMEFVHVTRFDTFNTSWNGETTETLTAEEVKRHL